MRHTKPLLLFCLAVSVISSSWAAAPSADEVIATSCSVALNVFSQCTTTLGDEKLSATCCTPYSVLKTFNCFCNAGFSTQAQAMMTGDVRQAILQCPGEGHISEPIKCNDNNQQVSAWLSEVDSGDKSSVDSKFTIMKEINGQLSLPQANQLPAQQDDLAKIISNEDSSITVDLTLDLGSAGGDKKIRRGVKLGTSDFDSTVSDLTAEVDFEIGPDVSSSEIRQILQGVTEWVSSMVDGNADPFGDLASLEKAGELSSISAHVADAISQMAGTWNALGANENMDVEITYEFDLGAPQYSLSAKQQPSRSELMSLGDTLITAADDYNMLDDMILSDDPHMDGHHMGHRHKCLFRQTYRWLCHHKDVIRMALVVELILCAVFAAVHVVWSCCVNTESSGDAESNLKAPLIESASAYTTADEKMIISPLWAHVMDSKSGVSPV